MLVSQEQFEQAVSAAASVLDRAWVDAPADRVRGWARDALRAAFADLGVSVGADPRLERHRASLSQEERLVTECRPPGVVGAGEGYLLFRDADGLLYRFEGRQL